MFATGETVRLAEWIIDDDICLVICCDENDRNLLIQEAAYHCYLMKYFTTKHIQ